MGKSGLNKQIVKLRRNIYDHLKSRALELEKPTAQLLAYAKEQIDFSKREFKSIEIEQIKNSVLNSHVIYIGDFHTFDQNIRNVLRVIKFIIGNKEECIIGLEMIHSEHQIFIDAFLERHITELELLESINYHNSWRFPWTHYKLIFDIARKNDLKIIGLNTEGSLPERDRFAAKQIIESYKNHPKAKLIVLYGELHITPSKMPQDVLNLNPNISHTIIHQNLDEVYWEFIKTGKEQGIVSFNDFEFCIISAPPWIKYESMIYWYENLCDDPDFDIHEYIIENGKKVFSDDTDETFLQLSIEIARQLNIEVEVDEIENFNLYDHTNLEYTESLIDQYDLELREFLNYLIETNKSFKLPNSFTYYCSSYSMNRIAYLVGVHIFHLTHQTKKLDVTKVDNNYKFVVLCLEAIYAYFFSKIVNPHRKCDLYGDIEKNNNTKASDELALAMEIIDSQNIKDIPPRKLSTLYEASLIVGHILGEYFYQSLASKDNDLNKDDLIKTQITPESFHHLKNLILQNKDYKKHQKRYF